MFYMSFEIHEPVVTKPLGCQSTPLLGRVQPGVMALALCLTVWALFRRGAKCSSVARAFAYGALGRRIDPPWWTHSVSSRSSQCSMTGVPKTVVCAILSVGWCI